MKEQYRRGGKRGSELNEIGKASGLDGFQVECLKIGGMALLESRVRLLNVSVDTGVVP